MKVVINVCFGGFSLSRAATKRLAELQGRECYFFTHEYQQRDIKYIPYVPSEGRDLFWSAFDVPNPNKFTSDNDWYESHLLDSRPPDRSDPLLIRVVEELGKDANGAYAELRIVEIPDGIEWEIDEYDGTEMIREKHRTWR